MEIRNIDDAMQAFHVTREQLQRVQAHLDGPDGKWYYLVESQSEQGVVYCVAYNREHKVLQCLPWQGGKVCKASESGYGCWHRRASMAVHALFNREMQVIREAKARTEEIEAEMDPRHVLIGKLVAMGYSPKTAREIANNPSLSLSLETYAQIIQVGVNWPDNRLKK